jgi:hypothetical protein
LKELESQISLETLVSTVTDKELKDVDFCRRIVARAITEKHMDILGQALGKMTEVFVFSDDKFRKNLTVTMYSSLRDLSLKNMISLGRETILGNILTLYFFAKRNTVVTFQNLETMSTLSDLKFIDDPFMLELCAGILEHRIIFDLDERVEHLPKPEEIEKTTRISEGFFENGLIEKNEDTIGGFAILYKNSTSPDLRLKGEIVTSLVKKKLKLFVNLLSKIFGKNIETEQDILEHYSEIYDELARINTPIFFDFEDYVRYNGVLYNGNFFFLKYMDNTGKERILFPFDQIGLDSVQKVFDLSSGTYVTPKGRMGKMLPHEIFSFKKMAKIDYVPKAKLDAVSRLSEDEIGKKIREILKDQNITPHAPSELADIFTTKLLINNENDLRDSAFILKGKGYPRVYLRSLSSNLLKAVKLPVAILFLVYLGSIMDEAQQSFIEECRLRGRMYCIIDRMDLAKLLIAYRKLD